MTKPAVERRVITALFVDVVGSTALTAELGPERLKRVLERAFAQFQTAIAAEGGVVEKYVGDAVYALFGAPTAHADDPIRALRAAEACRRLAETGDLTTLRLAIRAGVETGEAVVDLTASVTARQQMSVGLCVNLAARLQQLAEPGHVLVGPICHHEVRQAAEFVPLGSVDLKGIGATEVWRLESVSETASGSELPFVGRETELALLQLAYARAKSCHSVLALVSGPPGQGKTRLVHEFISALGSGIGLLTARCRPAGERDTQNPLRQLLSNLDSPASNHADRLTPLFPDDRERLRVLAALSHSAGVSVEADLAGLPPDQRQDEIADGWRRYLASLARRQPLVVWVDDLHWADSAVVQLLDRLTLGADSPILVVATARPEISLQSAIRPGGDRFFITLDGLDPGSARRLAANAGSAEASGIERAEGNPLFILELARGTSKGGTIPLTLQGAIGARLDELTAEDRELLQHVSVVGDTFTVADASLLSGRTALELVPVLDRLADRQYLHRMAGGHRFHHALVRDVSYARLTAADRQHLHARYALEGLPEDDVEGVAHHLWEALGHPESDWVWEGDEAFPALRAMALTTHLSAARRSAARSAHQAAAEIGRRALRFCTTFDDMALAECAIAATCASAGDADEALARYLRARTFYGQAGQTPPPSFYPEALELPIYRSGMFRQPFAVSSIDELLDEGQRVCRDTGDLTSLTRLTTAAAYRWHDANRLVEALRMADQVDDVAPLTFCLGHAAILLGRLGDFAVAARTYDRLDRIAESSGAADRQFEFRAILALSTGDLDAAWHLAEQFMDASRPRGPHLRTHANRELSHVLLARGDWSALRVLAAETEQLVAEHPQTAFCYAVTTVQAFASIANAIEGHAVDAQSLRARAEVPLQAEPFERESLLVLLYACLGRIDAVDALTAEVAARKQRPFWFFHRMVVTAYTMLERWDRVEPALGELNRIAGKDSPYFAAFTAAVHEEMGASRGGPRPDHRRLKELGYVGWSRLLSHRPAPGRPELA